MRSFSFIAAATCIAVTAACHDSDRDIERRVKAELAADPEGAGVSVIVDDRVVRLIGVIDSREERIRLENRIGHLSGVTAVRNELVVPARVETTAAISDPERATAAAIDVELRAAGFDGLGVFVSNGTAHIRGKVPRERHDEALAVARRAAPAFRIGDELEAR